MGSNLLLSAAATILCCAALASAMPSGWQPIDNTTDPYVRELGEWAVAEHNAKVAKDVLRLQNVTSAMAQIDVGVTYMLDLDTVRPDGKCALYGAIVFEKITWPNATRELVFFRPAN